MINYFDNVSLLLPGFGVDGGTVFADYSPRTKTVGKVGDTKTVTAQFRYYDSSIYFDGTGDYLSVANNEFMMGTGDFTIAFWIRPDLAGVTSWAYLLAIGNDATNGVFGLARYGSSNPLSLYQDYYSNGWLGAAVSGSITDKTWGHVAVSRVNGVLRVFVNGVIGLTRDGGDGSNLTQTNLTIFARSNGGTPMRGHLQDLMIIKGAGLWVDNFVPPERMMKTLAGTVADDTGEPAIRTVRAYPRASGAPLFATQSAVDGTFALTVPDTEHTVIALDDAGTTYNAQVHDRVIPV